MRCFQWQQMSLVVSMVVGFLMIAAPTTSYAIPIHAHGDGWTSWERDSIGGTTPKFHGHTGVLPEEGDEAHQHYINVDFNGDNNTSEPFSAYGAWDDRTAYIDRDDPFGDLAEYNAVPVPHGYVRSGQEPRYKFVGDWSSGAAQSAQGLVKDAYDLWGSIAAEKSPVTGKNLITGIGFKKVTSGDAEILINWVDDNGASGGGFVSNIQDGSHTSANPVSVTFDNSFDWDFTKDGSAAALNKWHFFSVALHEIGHTTFLDHQLDNDLMDPTVGEPGNNDADGDGMLWRWHSLTNNVGENDFFNGFSRPAGAAGAWGPITDKDSVDAIKSLYSIPIPEPSTFAMAAIGLLGVGLCGWRRVMLRVRNRAVIYDRKCAN